MRYITVEGLSFQYDAEPVLDNIHYHLDSGEFVTLTGENGAAKSTLIKATLGILKPKKGTVTISDINKDGKISISDLAMVKAHLLGTLKITK